MATPLVREPGMDGEGKQRVAHPGSRSAGHRFAPAEDGMGVNADAGGE